MHVVCQAQSSQVQSCPESMTCALQPAAAVVGWLSAAVRVKGGRVSLLRSGSGAKSNPGTRLISESITCKNTMYNPEISTWTSYLKYLEISCCYVSFTGYSIAKLTFQKVKLIWNMVTSTARFGLEGFPSRIYPTLLISREV